MSSHLFRFCCFSLCVLALSACRDGLEPGYFPAGYTYHTNVYKAPVGPDAPDIGYKYSEGLNNEVLETWRVSVNTMIDRLENEVGLNAQDVYVEALPHMNAFNAAYDHVVREEFAARGYNLTDHNMLGLHIRYEAFRPDDEDKRHLHPFEENLNEDPKFRKVYTPERPTEFVLVMTARKDGGVIGQVSHTGRLPAFGYVVDEGQYAPEQRLRL